MLAFTSIFIVIQKTSIDFHHTITEQTASQVTNVITTEVELAKDVRDGYRRTFFLPEFINGYEYTMQLYDKLELEIDFRDKKHFAFFTEEVDGFIQKSYNEIAKVDNFLYLNCGNEPFDARDTAVCSTAESTGVNGCQNYLGISDCQACCNYWTVSECTDLCL